MSTESLRAELAEVLRTQGPGAAAELARAHGLTASADGELSDGDLEMIAAGKVIAGPGWGWGGFFGGFFFRRWWW